MTIEEAIVQLKELRKCEKYLYPSDIKAIDIALEHMDLYGTYISMNMHNKLYKKQKSINYELVDENQELINENKELKRLLRLAVEDFETLSDEVVSEDCDFNLFCKSCPFSSNDDYINCAKKWKHAEEAMKLLGDDADD